MGELRDAVRLAIRDLIDSAPPKRRPRQLPAPEPGAMTPRGFTYRMTPMARGIALGMCARLSTAQIGKILGQPPRVVNKTRLQLLHAVGVAKDWRNVTFAVRANAAIREEWKFNDSRNGSQY